MKIFLSHSKCDEQIAHRFSALLESIDSSIDVFCSSRKGSIGGGRDFVKIITREIDKCDIFIPLLSMAYFESKYSMIELGFSYACLYYKYTDSELEYIYPLCIPPLDKSDALAHTPLASLQVFPIDDPESLRVYIKSILDSKNILYPAGVNKQIHSFLYDINQEFVKEFNILNNVKILLCKSMDARGEDRDYLDYSLSPDNKGYTINFRAKPFNNSLSYPDFLSFVFKYVDKINLYNILNNYENAALFFKINNYTNSISHIDIEIKYSDIKDILYRKTYSLSNGEIEINIYLHEMKSEALKQISEICFVIHPSAYIEDEGMFQINDFKIKF